MPTPTPGFSSDLTPEQRREQVVAILSRAVLRRVRLLRRSPTNDAPEDSPIRAGEAIVADRGILA